MGTFFWQISTERRDTGFGGNNTNLTTGRLKVNPKDGVVGKIFTKGKL